MRVWWLLPPGLLLVLLLCAAGCTSYPVGGVSYMNGNLTVGISGPQTPQEVGVQATVYRVDEFSQQALFTTGTTAVLSGKETTVTLPMQLVTGNYKIYVYITRDGVRETAVIRDITV